MRFAPMTERLAGLGGAKWAVHAKARALAAGGHSVIELTIGEPDVATPPALLQAASDAMMAGRMGYSNGQGEPGLVQALAARYTARRGRLITPSQVMAWPGTQTVLYGVMSTLLGPGDEVLVGDPMYATYEGVIASTGATMVPVPLRPEAGFRMQAADVAQRITDCSRVLFLNTPHNPTGAVLREADIAALGRLAIKHDLWIVCDEVYEEMVFDGVPFASPLSDTALAKRVVVAASISKSHAAPGFRSGWCVGPEAFVPFIADATALAVSSPSPVAAGMVERFARRADILADGLAGVPGCRVHRPEAGMFALIDMRDHGMSGEAFALALLEATGVAVMPGESFGRALAGWLRVSLTQPDALISEAAARIAGFVQARVAA
jgi:arginine:pyruvate transaminase